ncbi:TetR/AcrR family transcriptional regulator [Cystobacter fuscus]|uniref:TetR/AcrR family transcriptional regulator n=1 Tax=Cystobacter fuscus TaxID=43 RepID=UPI0037BE4324
MKAKRQRRGHGTSRKAPLGKAGGRRGAPAEAEFLRARSEEQREVRRCAILATAAAMLEQMPVAEVGLNELARRVGLAKSNVLRYFESREAVLLELLDQAWKNWLAALPTELESGVRQGAPLRERVEQFAATFARSLAARQVFCDLFAARAAVLEHNVSTEVALRYKRTSIANAAAAGALLGRCLPELGERVQEVCNYAFLATTAIWTHSRASKSVLAAYEADQSLEAFRIQFAPTLQVMLVTLVTGALARAAPASGARKA